MQAYQWNAVEYAKHASVQQQWARELINKLKLKGNERILDIGSGDGKITAELAANVPNGFVIGIDNSDEMIRLSQSRYLTSNVKNLKFQKVDARELPFENEFDIIFSNAALHWVLDHKPVLHGIHKGLKESGKALLQMGGRGNAEDIKVTLDTLISTDEWRAYFENFNFVYGFHGVEEYRRWLYEAGLEALRVELIPKVAIHKDRTAFEGWIRTTWLPWTHRVPEEKRNIFISQLTEKYFELCPADKEGRIHVRMSRLEVEADKR